MPGKPKTVLMLTPIVGESLPRMIAGAQRATLARGWEFFHVVCTRGPDGTMAFERSPGGGTLSELLAMLRPDGAIVTLNAVDPDALRSAAGAAGLVGRAFFPVVHLGEPDTPAEAVYAHGDAMSFAGLALRELLRSGFGDFAYAPSLRDHPWSRARGEAFRRLVALAGRRFHAFPAPAHGAGRHSDDPPSTPLVDRLVPWIASLPRPCGLFAANDITGEAVLRACARLGLDVPAQVAVVGVDDVPRICDYTRPTLSSVRRDLESEGRAAADLLAAWLEHLRRRPRPVAVPAASLVRRQSTQFSSLRDGRVALAQEWIRLHAFEEGVGPRDVVRHMGVSRTTADRLFRAVAHHTILDEIRSTRIDAAKEKIRSGVPYDVAAAECGFSSTLDFRRVFRQLVGMPVVKWMNS